VNKWRDPDDIKEDFASGDPERIRIGVAGLREFSKEGDEVEMPVIGAALLLPFGDAPPDEVVIDLARLLMDYRSFVPPRSRVDTLNQLVELAVRYGVSQVIYGTSIELQCEPDPPAAVRAAVDYVRWRGLAAPREVEAARKLDAKLPVRRAGGRGAGELATDRGQSHDCQSGVAAGRSRSAKAASPQRVVAQLSSLFGIPFRG
jgi:hypothetical protein